MILDVHLHTIFSDGINTPAEMAAQVKRLKIDGFAITDHNTVKGQKIAREAAKKLKLTFVPGIEVSSLEGHVLGLFITENIPKCLSAEETVERIHEQGGIAIAAHPYDHFRESVKDLVRKVKFDYIEVYNTRAPFLPDNWKAQKVAKELGLKITAASDAHAIEEVGYGTVYVKGLNDFSSGKLKIHKANWTPPWILTYGKFRRLLKKHGLY
ncbi:TPA: PHP domain-containing protein [archaeon]|uniref:PHP domain-containing protein n=1 Tax=Candidatus Naiadarchaeum limnaeum TaxID=2756139 RepID=A0A832XI86_9ARCH|nr:PHP domain-containing protein [Candidatus Naiadarchaeum limnaeum]